MSSSYDVALRLPSFTAPPAPPLFSFDLVQVAEQQVELRWSDLSPLNSLNLSSFEIFLQYQEEADGELFQGEEDKGKKLGDKKGTLSQSSVKKIVRVPISLSSRGVTVAGLSPGSVYSFTLRAAHPAGSTWSLGQTRTAYTSESADFVSVIHVRHTKTSYANSFKCLCSLLFFYRATFSSKYHCWPHNRQSD